MTGAVAVVAVADCAPPAVAASTAHHRGRTQDGVRHRRRMQGTTPATPPLERSEQGTPPLLPARGVRNLMIPPYATASKPARAAAPAAVWKGTAAAPAVRKCAPIGSGGGTAAGDAGRYDKSELHCTCSDYLCLFCYDPMYIDIEAGRELCLNTACATYANQGEISGKIYEHDGPREAEARLQKSVIDLRGFSKKLLLGQLYLARRNMCVSLLRGVGLNVFASAAIDYLLTQLGDDVAWGHSKDGGACRSAFGRYFNSFLVWQFLELLDSKTIVTTPDGRPYLSKYFFALEGFHNALGVVSGANRQGHAALHAFSFIDNKAREEPGRDAFDFDRMFKNAMPLASSLNLVFKISRAASNIHRYPSRPEDVVALRSLWGLCRSGGPVGIGRGQLHEVYDDALREASMRGDFGQFLKDYASGEEYAPVMVFDGEDYWFDYPTILLYLVYIHSNNRTRSGTQTAPGRVTYGKKRQEAAQEFEAQVRQKMRDDGFDTYPRQGGEKFVPSFGSERREFDCIAVDRERKIVVLIEAKYRDPPPSSMAGADLVDRLVLDKRGGLLGQAKDHHTRRQFFIRHFSGMAECGLDLEGCFLDYTIHTVLVTKHVPPISLHKSVRIVSYDEFLSIDFRGGGGAPHG